jgi:cellulose synthase (UDP-forming)
LDYISGASYWLLKGPITVAYLCAPIIFILFGLSFMNINFIDYFMIIIPYISVSMISFIYIIRRENEYGMKGYLLHQTVEYLEFPTATVSFLKWLFRRKFTFVVTPKGGTERGKKKHRRDKFTLLPHYLTFLGLTIALCIGALRLFTGNYISPYPMIVNLIWVVYFMPFAISGLLVSLSSRKEKGTSALIVPI